jgi:hypothetical protein
MPSDEFIKKLQRHATTRGKKFFLHAAISSAPFKASFLGMDQNVLLKCEHSGPGLIGRCCLDVSFPFEFLGMDQNVLLKREHSGAGWTGRCWSDVNFPVKASFSLFGTSRVCCELNELNSSKPPFALLLVVQPYAESLKLTVVGAVLALREPFEGASFAETVSLVRVECAEMRVERVQYL